jgi:hypothetical protein
LHTNVGKDLEKTKLLLLLHRFESIRDQAERILTEVDEFHKLLINVSSIEPLARSDVLGNINAKIIEASNIVKEYDEARISARTFLKVRNLAAINLEPKSSEGQIRGALRRVITRCDSVVGMISNSISPISSEDVEKLRSLREQLRKISLSTELAEVELFVRNIEEAMSEYERGGFLASVLITSRVIIYLLDQLEGETDREKVKLLIDKGIIPKKREDISASTVKACHKARNYFSHDIKIFPQPSDAIAILGDYMNLLQFLLQLKIETE